MLRRLIKYFPHRFHWKFFILFYSKHYGNYLLLCLLEEDCLVTGESGLKHKKAICEIVVSSVFLCDLDGLECAKRVRRGKRKVSVWCESVSVCVRVRVGRCGLNKPQNTWAWQIILLNFKNCNWKTCENTHQRGHSVGQRILGDFSQESTGVVTGADWWSKTLGRQSEGQISSKPRH